MSKVCQFLAGVLFFIFLVFSAEGQGAVRFANDSLTLSSPPDRLIRFALGSTRGNPYGTNLAPAVGTNFLVQLYYGASTADEASLVPVSNAPGRLRSSTSAGKGEWSLGGFRTLNGFPYGSGWVKLQVRVWDIDIGPAFTESSFGSGLVGSSVPFLYFMPADGSDPPAAFSMENFTSFSIVPEPGISTMLLLGLYFAARAYRKTSA